MKKNIIAIIIIVILMVVDNIIVFSISSNLSNEKDYVENGKMQINTVNFYQDGKEVTESTGWYNIDKDKDLDIKVEYSGKPNYIYVYDTPSGTGVERRLVTKKYLNDGDNTDIIIKAGSYDFSLSHLQLEIVDIADDYSTPEGEYSVNFAE